eukprot:CAMPEP_0170179148 /NCGR_PEP_ID=MMETSP0040_2-20121228/16346_1 /TAXON_ID=641309 /ORGANISM="Lotharella oceanica, Strain CCMP622" /LENGTH=400 /DNA_ID=CAMNT_0010423009 /DNA_START=89 /DNA_END=1291 /DNA_ORIENTATION=-
MQYFTDETSDQPKGSINLTGSTLITDPAKNNKNGFTIKVSSSSRMFYIQADDRKTADEWILAIAQSEGVVLEDDSALGLSLKTREEKLLLGGGALEDWSSDEETDPTHVALNANLLLFGADIVQVYNALNTEFQTADKDKDGWITQQELEPILATTYQRFGYPPSQIETMRLATRLHMEIIDKDARGRIDRGEFMILLKLVLASSLALDKVIGISKKDFYPGDRRFFRAMNMIKRADNEAAKPANKSKAPGKAKVTEESLLLTAPVSKSPTRNKRRVSAFGVRTRQSSAPSTAPPRPPDFKEMWAKLITDLWESIGELPGDGGVLVRKSVARAYPYFVKVLGLQKVDDEKKNKRDSWTIARALDPAIQRQVSFNKKELDGFCRRIVLYGMAMEFIKRPFR